MDFILEQEKDQIELITFNSLEEMKPYYNKDTNTYNFSEKVEQQVEINFNLDIESNIEALSIKAKHIKAKNIDVLRGIKSKDIIAENITAGWGIYSWDITAKDIDSHTIRAQNIKANNIYSCNIHASSINANDIDFHDICFAYESFVCNSIKGRRKNHKYFCIDSEVIIKSENI